MKAQDCIKILEEIRTSIEEDIKISDEKTRIGLHYSIGAINNAITRISEEMMKEQGNWYLLGRKLCSGMNLRYGDGTIIENIYCSVNSISGSIVNGKGGCFIIGSKRNWEKFIEEKGITF